MSRPALIRLAATLPLGDKNRRVLLAELSRVSSFSTSEAWDFIEQFSGLTERQASAKLKQVIEDWGNKNGRDWRKFQLFIRSFDQWFSDTSGILRQRIEKYQRTPGNPMIMPSDDGLGDMARGITFQGRKLYQEVLQDPNVLPKLEFTHIGPYGQSQMIKTPGKYPKLEKVLSGMWLFLRGYNFTKLPAPKGWGMTWATRSDQEREEYWKTLAPVLWKAVLPDSSRRSPYWDFTWKPDFNNIRLTDSGATFEVRLEARWSGPKSLKKQDLETALRETEKVFKGLLEMGDQTNAGKTLAVYTATSLRTKDHLLAIYFHVIPGVQGVRKEVSVPLTGTPATDQAQIKAVLAQVS